MFLSLFAMSLFSWNNVTVWHFLCVFFFFATLCLSSFVFNLKNNFVGIIFAFLICDVNNNIHIRAALQRSESFCLQVIALSMLLITLVQCEFIKSDRTSATMTVNSCFGPEKCIQFNPAVSTVPLPLILGLNGNFSSFHSTAHFWHFSKWKTTMIFRHFAFFVFNKLELKFSSFTSYALEFC